MTSDAPASVETAVIVAAGKGTRLEGKDNVPKPLQRVVGVPLIARVMRAASQAGIRRFVVVIGFRADDMRASLPACVPSGCELELIENPRFEDPNGVSLAAGVAGLDEPFALLMSDHLFTPDRLEAAIARYDTTRRNLLVVQSMERFTGDPDDATRVRVADGHITAIDKLLDPYDAVDTGMFVLDAGAVRDALEGAGDAPSISDGMRRLAENGELDGFEVESGLWQDVDTPEDAKDAEQMLYASLRKPNDGLLARHVNRRISLAVSTRVWRYGVTPNLSTIATLFIGLGAGWAFAQSSSPLWGLIGATLFQMQSILDGVDGELARLLHKESRLGFWLDVGCDNLTHMAVFGGIALGQMVDGPAGPWEVLGVLAVSGVVVSFIATAPLINKPQDKGASGARGTLGKIADGLARRDFTYLLFPLAALGWLGGFLWAAAIGTWVYAAIVWGLRWSARRRVATDAA